MQLPALFLQSLHNLQGFSKQAFIAAHAAGNNITSIRLNPFKNRTSVLPATVSNNVAWCGNGYYLLQRPSFTSDPLFHAGAYYVQEASSMFLEQALQQTVDLLQPLKVLDLCAAPGGKSTLIQSLLNEQSFLVSNEVIKTRVNILAENTTKWGAANVVITNNDPIHFQRLQNYFDVIVVDAPCSGSGLFRKDPAAITAWSEDNVALCSQRQQRILADVLPALKEDGVLIYSTCSYSPQEDEAIADWLIGECQMKSLSLKTENSWGIVETQSPKQQALGYRFYPDKVKGEGFFIAAFKKQEYSNVNTSAKSTKQKTEKVSVAETAVIKPYLKNADNFFFIKQQTDVLALPVCMQQELEFLQAALYIKKAGIKLGAVIRNELVPEHELAVSTVLDNTLPVVDVDETTALQFLRRNDFNLDAAIKGWAIISYKNLPLGWAKILPNRINNYYPPAWRIVNK